MSSEGSRILGSPRRYGMAFVHTLLFTSVVFFFATGAVWFSDPVSLAQLRKAGKPLEKKFPNKNISCFRAAASVEEPFTDDYQPEKPRLDMNGPIYARYRWDRPITHQDLDKALEANLAVFLKIIDSKLYLRRSGHGYNQTMVNMAGRFVPLVEQIMLTLRMYDVPNVDLAITTSDLAPCGIPIVSYANTESCDGNAGFTIPSFVTWEYALGPKQLEEFQMCLDERYPYDKRIPKAVFRGSLTGHVGADNFFARTRWRMGYIGDVLNHIMDAGIDSFTPEQEKSTFIGTLRRSLHLRDRIPEEDFNKYAFIIDLDGYGWSSPFSRRLNYNTPIVKEEMSHFRETIADFVKDGEHMFEFKSDLSDLVPKVTDLVNEYKIDRTRLKKVIANAQKLAMEHESQLGILRATAYALTAYSSFLTWEPQMEEGFVEIPQFFGAKNQHWPNKVYQHEGVLDARQKTLLDVVNMCHDRFNAG